MNIITQEARKRQAAVKYAAKKGKSAAYNQPSKSTPFDKGRRKNRMKKVLATLLSVILILAVCPLGMFTVPASAETAGGTCGLGLTWEYDISTNILTISGTGEMSKYTSSSYNGSYVTKAPWQGYYSTMRTIVIGNGVTSIGKYAFYGCRGLTSITIPDSVTSIGDRAFDGCTGLTNITIGNGVTSIGGMAFDGCTGLTSITIPDSVTSIGYRAFYGCTGLTSITIGNGVTSIGEKAFYNTAWYKNKPNGLVYAGKVAYEMKGSCPSSVTIKEGTLGIAAKAFYGCRGLTSITIPDSVTSIGNSAFYYCTGLTSITIPDSVTSIDSDAFYYCTGLTSITIPDSITSICYSAFSYCTGLTSITIPDSVTSIGNEAFYNTAWYNNQPDGLVYAGKVAYEMKGSCPSSVTIKEGTLGIAASAFYGCTGLTSITIPDSVTSIGSLAFCGCTGLTSITIPDSVTSIDYRAFYGCTGLKTVCYCGTADQWNQIQIDSDNSCLTSATRTYHSYGNWQTVIPPTCMAGGTECAACIYCGNEVTRNISALGHSYSAIVTEATCIAQGYTTYTCTVCGDSYTDTYTAKTDHAFGDWQVVTAYSCMTDGLERRICSACGETEERTIPAHHVEQILRTVEPTCTAGGYDIVRCTVCGVRYQTNLTEALGHDGILLQTIAPTCTEQGYSVYSCERCGGSYTSDYTDSLGHDYQFTRTVAANCVKAGYHLNTCARCGDTKQTAIPAMGHCFFDGFCLDCGVSEEIAPFDLNGDARLNAQDLAELTIKLLRNEAETICDVNQDGVSNILDLIAMKKKLAA